MKGKITSGSTTLGDGASRWSTRQASLFYRRQNNKSFPCRRIPSLFSDVKVLTDADLIKESQGNSKNMVSKSGTSTKRPTALGDYKTKQGQLNKAKEISARKVTCASTQVTVKTSKCETKRKRKSSGQDICDRPSKKKPPTVSLQGVQKNTDNRQIKIECKSPKKSKLVSDETSTIESKNLTAESVSSTQYKILMTRPAVPTVPVGTHTNAQQQSSTVLVLKKVVPPAEREVNRLPVRKSLETVVSNLTDRNVIKNVCNDEVEEWENRSDETPILTVKLEKKGKDSVDIDNRRHSELHVKTAKCCAPNVMTDKDDFHSDEENSVGEINSATNQTDIQIESNSSDEHKRENKTSLLNTDVGFSGTQESKTENRGPIKRSARISERKAKITASSLAAKDYLEKSDWLKGLEPERNQSSTISNALSLNSSNLSTVTTTNTEHQPNTEQQPQKHKTKSANNIKYTQRMTWQLQPQVTPTDNRNPVSVGDIVWGKVHGHPWWPGKVLAISGIRNEDSKNPWNRDAHVSWFGSNTSSIMPLHSLQLFLPNFAKRHKKRKKGFYRIAVREAQAALKLMADESCLAW